MTTRAERQAASNDPNGPDQVRAKAETEKHITEAVKAYKSSEEQDRRDYQDWLDGKIERPSEGAARLEAQAWRNRGAAASVRQVLRPYAPTARACPQCAAEYVGASRFCPPCTDKAIAQHERRAAERAAQVDGMTVHEARHKWANLPPDVGRTWEMALPLEVSGLVQAISATKFWVAGDGPAWLVLTGSIGIGKSHLAEVAARELAAKGQRVRWQPVGELLDRLRVFGEADEVNSYAHLGQVAATPWLVLDDIGVSKPSAWVLDRLHALINSRAVRQARTMITTNDTLAGLTERVGDRVADRVYDSHSGLVAVVTMSGPSYRTGR